MREAGYEEAEPHAEEHIAFIEWLNSVSRVQRAGDRTARYKVETVRQFLSNWLINHILKSDMAYKGRLSGQP